MKDSSMPAELKNAMNHKEKSKEILLFVLTFNINRPEKSTLRDETWYHMRSLRILKDSTRQVKLWDYQVLQKYLHAKIHFRKMLNISASHEFIMFFIA